MKLAWHWFILDVPATWEVIRHRNHADDGQFHLSDRHGEQLQVFWKRLKSPPALPARLCELAGNVPRHKIVEHHGWQICFGPPTFAARYDDPILLTLIFPAAQENQVRAVLESFRPNTGAEKHWAAFGLDCVLPAAYEPTDIRALPAAQVIRFEAGKHDSVTVHRYGMLGLIEDPPAAFFARLKRKPLHRAGAFMQASRYPGEKLTYRGGCAWVWRCEELQRLYCVDQTGAEIPGLADKVHCQ
jgi:hypothetical protein